VVADPDALGEVGEAPVADAVGAVAEGRPGVTAALGRAVPDGGAGWRRATPEEVCFAVADDVLLAAAAAASATPGGFRAGEAAEEPADTAEGDEAVVGVEPVADAAEAPPGVSPVEPAVELGDAPAELGSAAADPVVAGERAAPEFAGATVEIPAAAKPAGEAVAPPVVEPAVAAEPAAAAVVPLAAVETIATAEPVAAIERGADLAEPPAAANATAGGVVPAELAAESAPAGEAAAALDPVRPAEPAEPLAGVASAAGIVASLGPKSVGSNMGDAQVPEYAESRGAVAHDPDDEVLELAAVDGSFEAVLLGLAAFAAEPAVAFVDVAAVLGLFAPKAAAFAAAPDALVEPALPPWPAVPGSRVGIPNPAGEIGFCGSPDVAALLAAAGFTAAGEGGGVAALTWGAGADAGTLVPGALDPSGSSVSSN
jgi:hypothetical protein